MVTLCNKHNSTNDILYMISLSIYLLYCGLLTSFYAVYITNDTLYKGIVILCMVLLVIKESSAHISSRNIFIIGLLLAFSVLVIKNGEGLGQKSILFAIVYIVCARNISLRKVLSLAALIIAVILSLVIVSSKLGIITNFTNVRGDGTYRNPLGFRWVLFAPTFYFELVCILVYLYRNKINWVALFLLGFTGWWIYKETDSRMCFVMTEVLILYVVLDKVRLFLNIRAYQLSKYAFLILTVSYILFFVISVVATVKYDPENEIYLKINGILTDRLRLGQDSIDKYGVSLLGIRGIEWTGHGRDMFGNELLLEYNYVDCGYIVLLQRFGIVFTAFWLLCNTVTLYKAYRKGDYYLMIILSLIAAHLMIDDLQLSLHYNVFWLANTLLFVNIEKREHREILVYG